MALDLATVALMLFAAVHVRPLLSFLPFTHSFDQPQPTPFVLYIVFPVLWVSVLLLLSVYDGRRNLRVVDEFATVTTSALLATISMAGLLYLSYRDISRVAFLSFALLGYAGMLFWRAAARLYFRRASASHTGLRRRVLIIGAGPVGRNFQQQIAENPDLGLEVVGFLDDDSEKRRYDLDILGSTAEAAERVQALKIDDVVFALPLRAQEKINTLVTRLHAVPVKVWVIPDYFHLALHHAAPEEFAGITMLDLRAPALNDYQRMVKRALDLSISFAVLPFLLPLLGLIALAIRLEDEGPILFNQDRVGENGRLFKIHKFRTMVPNAEALRHLVEHLNDKGQIIHKTDHDPRVTKVGSFLRRWSLDELPQIFNILKGEMSWVGPRPEMPHLVAQYESWQRKRFAVPQGLTGWWQVNGRSDKPMHLNTEYDLYYVQNYSFLLDILILLKTVWVVLKGKGAY